jgi:hypothetical protein
MPWTVQLQDEIGKPVIPEYALIEFETIPEDADIRAQFKLVHYIDPYCDTYFNHTQMADFLADWDSLTPSGEQHTQWQFVRKMAVLCLDEYHLYLRFIGD